jgi:hypothetical protein
MTFTTRNPSESEEAREAWLTYSGLRHRDPSVPETPEESLQRSAFMAGIYWLYVQIETNPYPK